MSWRRRRLGPLDLAPPQSDLEAVWWGHASICGGDGDRRLEGGRRLWLAREGFGGCGCRRGSAQGGGSRGSDAGRGRPRLGVVGRGWLQPVVGLGGLVGACWWRRGGASGCVGLLPVEAVRK